MAIVESRSFLWGLVERPDRVLASNTEINLGVLPDGGLMKMVIGNNENSIVLIRFGRQDPRLRGRPQLDWEPIEATQMGEIVSTRRLTGSIHTIFWRPDDK